MESGSSLSNLLRCCRICLVVESVSPSLNLPCRRRTCFAVVKSTLLSSNLGGGWQLFRCFLRWPGVRYRTGQWDGRNKGIAKTSHDACRGSSFVTHFVGLPISGSPLMFPPSLIPSSGEDEPPTSLRGGEGRVRPWLNYQDRWGCWQSPHPLRKGRGS